MHKPLEKPKPTDEQQEVISIVNSTEDNVLINALAGTGKTSTLEMMIPLIKTRPILYVCFNKANADEAREKFPSDIVEVRTCNSIGNEGWSSGIARKTIVDQRKTYMLFKMQLEDYSRHDQQEIWESYGDITGAVAMSKHLGYVPNGKFQDAKRLITQAGLCGRLENHLSPLALEVVDSILCNSIKAAYNGQIDFDDQVYMPSLFGGSFRRFPIVLVDEDQDLSPTFHHLLKKLAKNRLVAVGDRWQSIYHFRGAETNGVDRLKQSFNMTELPLSISFRCPETIVRAVHWHVPHFRWIKPGGHYESLQQLDPMEIPDGAAILCRNNAPLFRAAYALLSRGRSVSVAGSDIGPKIIKLLQKVGSDRDTRDDLLLKITAWREEKLQSTNSPATINDQADCMAIFASWGSNLAQAIAYANRIFKEQGTIELSTGHKAKGKEWDVVYHLDPWLCKENDQDLNLKYVITTRSKDRLYLIDTKELQWE